MGAFPAQIVTDGGRMRQIVTNGLTNAVKYARPGTFGGPIQVRVSLRDAPPGAAAASAIAVEVLDTGPGLRGQTESALLTSARASQLRARVPSGRPASASRSATGSRTCLGASCM
jgi:K+-sensing histidine kinase KdpD